VLQKLKGGHLLVFAANTERWVPSGFCCKNWKVGTFWFLLQKLKGGYLLVSAAKTERWVPSGFCCKNWKVGTFWFLLQILKGGYLSISAAKTERWVPFDFCCKNWKGTFWFLLQKLKGGYLSISAAKTERWVPSGFCCKNWKVGTFRFLLQKLKGIAWKVGTFQFLLQILKGGHLAKTERWVPSGFCCKNWKVGTFWFLMQKLKGGYLLISDAKTERWVPSGSCMLVQISKGAVENGLPVNHGHFGHPCVAAVLLRCSCFAINFSPLVSLSNNKISIIFSLSMPLEGVLAKQFASIRMTLFSKRSERASSVSFVDWWPSTNGEASTTTKTKAPLRPLDSLSSLCCSTS
jgi:hypothetical protein